LLSTGCSSGYMQLRGPSSDLTSSKIGLSRSCMLVEKIYCKDKVREVEAKPRRAADGAQRSKGGKGAFAKRLTLLRLQNISARQIDAFQKLSLTTCET